jgi:hypothetical protein
VTVLGLAGLLFGLVCVTWLLFGRQGDVAELFAAAFGDGTTAARLADQRLASFGPVFGIVVPLLLEWALTLILITAAVGLLRRHPAARWAALFAAVVVVVLESLRTLLQVFYLTRPGQPVKLVPMLMNALLTLLAITFWGGLFLPEVVTAYAGAGAEPAPQ